MNFKPIFDRVLIKPQYDETRNSTGLVLPETSQEQPQIGVGIEVGDGENFDNQKTTIKVKKGDTVVYCKYAGTELKLNGETYIVMRQIDIIGVLNERENNC